MKTYRAAVIGCSRIGGFIANEVVGHEGPTMQPPSSHGGGYEVSDRTDLWACSDLREDVLEEFGKRYDVPKERQYLDYREMIEKEKPDIVSVTTPSFARAEPIIFAAEHGVRIGVENCPMLFTADEWPGGKNLAISPAIWRRMFEAIPDANFGLNYDPSHLVWQHMDWLAPLTEFAKRIFHVHAKDVAIDQAALDNVGILAHPLEYHAPKLPGRGDIDWATFCDALRASGYDGPVCVEVEDREFEDTLEARKESLRLSHQHLAALLKQV